MKIFESELMSDNDNYNNAADMNFDRDFGFGINAVSSNVISGNSSLIIRISRGALFGANTLLIICFNILCMVILRYVSGFNDITKIFIYSVNVADLCTGLFYGTLFTVAYSIGYWPLGSQVCYIHICAGHLFLFASVVSMLILNFERYIAVTNPLRYPVLLTTKRARGIVAIAWLSSVLIVMTYSVYFYSKSTAIEADEQLGCQIDYTNKVDIFLLSLKVVMIAIIPLIITVGLYTHLFIIARRHAKKIATHERIMASAASSSGSSVAGNRTSESNAWAFVRSACKSTEMKAATTFFLITFTSVMAWLPYTILELYTSLTGNAIASHVNFSVRLFMMGHCWLNVVIYYLRSNTFKQAIQDIVQKRCKGRCSCCLRGDDDVVMSSSVSRSR